MGDMRLSITPTRLFRPPEPYTAVHSERRPTIRCLRSAGRGKVDRQVSCHRLSAAATERRQQHLATAPQMDRPRRFARPSRNQHIRSPGSFHRGPGSGSGSPQEGTPIRSTTTRQPAHQARQPKAKNRTAAKMTEGCRKLQASDFEPAFLQPFPQDAQKAVQQGRSE